MAQKNYSLDDVHVSFNGALISEGLMSVKIAQANDAFDIAVGAGGHITRIRRVDFSGTVSVTIAGSSPANLILSAFHEVDKRSPNGTGVGILYIEQGNDKYIADRAWIMKAPDAGFNADSIDDREWVFQCADLKRIDAGN